MVIIVCVDDVSGMMFNNRRQSRDRAVIEKIKSICGKKQLRINEYSRNLFSDNGNIIVSEDFLENAEVGDYCFVENIALIPFESKIEKIIIFKWNRVYPADRYLDINLGYWSLTENFEFDGNSHERITMEVYIK